MKLLYTLILVVGASATLSASPIRPDIKKLLSAPRPTQQFIPARAGWDGAGTTTTATATSTPAMDAFGPTAVQRKLHRTLAEVMTPDWRVFILLGALIVLLRLLRARATPDGVAASNPTAADAVDKASRTPAA